MKWVYFFIHLDIMYVMTQFKIKAEKQNIDEAISSIEKEIKTRQIPQNNVGSFLLYSEEILLQLIKNSEKKDNTINIRITGKKDRVKANFTSTGKELVLDETFLAKDLFEKAEFDDEQTIIISKMILKANSDKINVHYKKGINYAQINSTAKVQKSAGLIIWMFGGILLGLIIRLIGNSGITGFSSELFSLVSTMFMNAIKTLVTPLVFFSIADSVTGFSDVGAFGRIGGKVVASYIIFSIIALFVSAGTFFVLKPGDISLAPELIAFIGKAETQVSTASVSLIDTISDIVPSGFVSAFSGQNMTQVIFLAVLAGFASGKLGNHSESVQSFLSAGNSLFSKLIAIVVKTLKPVCACMMASVSLTLSTNSIVQQFKVILCILIALGVMFVLYTLFIAIVGKQNPLSFFTKFKKAFVVAFTTMSSSATIPTSMQCCDDMGVSPKVYSFSIPLGSTINMNGTCIFMLMITLFFSRVMGVTITLSNLIPLIFTTLLLAVSAPGIPGAAIACLAILLNQLGIPAGAVGYCMGIYTITDGILTAVNVTGDAVVTYVVSKSEHMLKSN